MQHHGDHSLVSLWLAFFCIHLHIGWHIPTRGLHEHNGPPGTAVYTVHWNEIRCSSLKTVHCSVFLYFASACNPLMGRIWMQRCWCQCIYEQRCFNGLLPHIVCFFLFTQRRKLFGRTQCSFACNWQQFWGDESGNALECYWQVAPWRQRRWELQKGVSSCQKFPKVATSCQKLPQLAKSCQKLPQVQQCLGVLASGTLTREENEGKQL